MDVKDLELLPCPFCGSKGVFKYDISGYRNGVYIKCSNCGATAKTIYESIDYCAADEAAKLWNQRVDLHQLQELLNDESED